MGDNTINVYLSNQFTFDKTSLQSAVEELNEQELINIVKSKSNIVNQCMKANWWHAYFLLCEKHNINKFVLTKKDIFQNKLTSILRHFRTSELVIDGVHVADEMKVKFHGKLILTKSEPMSYPVSTPQEIPKSKFNTTFSLASQKTEECLYNFYMLYNIVENISKYLSFLSEDSSMSSILSDILPYSCGMSKASSVKHKEKSKRGIKYKNPVFTPVINIDKKRGIAAKTGRPYDFNTQVLNGNDKYIEGSKVLHRPITYYNPTTNVTDLTILSNAFTNGSECLLQIEWPSVASNKYIVCKPEINFVLVTTNESYSRSGDPFAEDATESDINSLSDKPVVYKNVEDDRESELSFRSEETDLILSGN